MIENAHFDLPRIPENEWLFKPTHEEMEKELLKEQEKEDNKKDTKKRV